MSLRWEDADYAFPAAGLDCFLRWAAECGASDVCFQTGAPAFIEVDGLLCRARERNAGWSRSTIATAW